MTNSMFAMSEERNDSFSTRIHRIQEQHKALSESYDQFIKNNISGIHAISQELGDLSKSLSSLKDEFSVAVGQVSEICKVTFTQVRFNALKRKLGDDLELLLLTVIKQDSDRNQVSNTALDYIRLLGKIGEETRDFLSNELSQKSYPNLYRANIIRALTLTYPIPESRLDFVKKCFDEYKELGSSIIDVCSHLNLKNPPVFAFILKTLSDSEGSVVKAAHRLLITEDSVEQIKNVLLDQSPQLQVKLLKVLKSHRENSKLATNEIVTLISSKNSKVKAQALRTLRDVDEMAIEHNLPMIKKLVSTGASLEVKREAVLSLQNVGWYSLGQIRNDVSGVQKLLIKTFNQYSDYRANDLRLACIHALGRMAKTTDQTFALLKRTARTPNWPNVVVASLGSLSQCGRFDKQSSEIFVDKLNDKSLEIVNTASQLIFKNYDAILKFIPDLRQQLEKKLLHVDNEIESHMRTCPPYASVQGVNLQFMYKLSEILRSLVKDIENREALLRTLKKK